MHKHDYFSTPVWTEHKPEFLKSLNKASNEYIKAAREKNKQSIKENKDFGTSHHSTPVVNDTQFAELRDYIGKKAVEFLNWQGFDTTKYTTMISEMWVQEFSKKGGGHHSAHQHWNQHVSGFYFLKCSNKTSFPIFHDPRSGATMTKLHQKQTEVVTYASELVHFKVIPGTLIIFPGYMEHEYAVDHGIEPFRFIHWNIQAIPKEMARNVV